MIHLAALITALVIGVGAELFGVWRHKQGKVDTYTEIVHWIGERIGWWAFPLGIFLIGLLVWSIPHLWEALLGDW
jgi:hypothetical protein